MGRSSILSCSVVLLAIAQQISSFKVSLARSRQLSHTSLRATEPEQTVTDLNLEEMFEVFEAADEKIASPKATTTSSTSKVSKSSSSGFKPSATVGSSAPFGFFDPASMSEDVSEDQYKLYQEAEIKHGRVAMLAFVGLIMGEIVQPSLFFDGQITGPAIYQFQQADAILPLFWAGVLAFIGAIETRTILTAWQPLEETLREPVGVAKLRKTYTAGDLGFDPLGLKPSSSNVKALNEMKTRELNNGRLAMIGVAGIVAQELVTGLPLF